MLLRPRPVASSTSAAEAVQASADRKSASARKRKADFQDTNERLFKRLSLLNIEQNGAKLYVPVEKPQVPAAAPSAAPPATRRAKPRDGDTMQVDDSKHKVYIYNIDDELSSESEPEDGKLVFLSDIDKHLRQNRIPASVLPNKDGELAGMQMVLYSEPTSLTVPEERDSVRKAIIEARARHRDKLREQREGRALVAPSFSSSQAGVRKVDAESVPMQCDQPIPGTWGAEYNDYDGEAMDLD